MSMLRHDYYIKNYHESFNYLSTLLFLPEKCQLEDLADQLNSMADLRNQ